MGEPATPTKSFLAERRCKLCDSKLLDKNSFISHLLGKKHMKKARSAKDDEALDCTLCVKGYLGVPRWEVITYFWDLGMVGGFLLDKVSFLQFASKKATEAVFNGKHVLNGHKLSIRYKVAPPENNNRQSYDEEPRVPQLSRTLSNFMLRILSRDEIDECILNLVREIELTQLDLREREYVRFLVQSFLQPDFPGAQAFIFGSSSNNLGFHGCDLDLYVNLLNQEWLAAGGKIGQVKRRAEELTRFLAKQIRLRRRGYNVVPIARARVPIVKFQDVYNGMQVDLSFKNELPLYNTSLIRLYTRMHSIVRPYLMLLRYWAKIQNVAGGGQPCSLLTNYAFTMLMLFWLMFRQTPIVPPVALLKCNSELENCRPKIIDGWDCSFANDVGNWPRSYHKTSLLDLAKEFFQFYSEVDTQKWVVCPLLGHLVTRRDMLSQNPSLFPPLLADYCRDRPIENSPLCVQDPFEHSHNITKGLRMNYLVEFQRKCQKAFEITSSILDKSTPLSHLFEVIVLEELGDDTTQSEPSTVNICEDTTEDSVEILGELFKENSDENTKVNQDEASGDDVTILDEDVDASETRDNLEGSGDLSSNKCHSSESLHPSDARDDDESDIVVLSNNAPSKECPLIELDDDTKINDLISCDNEIEILSPQEVINHSQTQLEDKNSSSPAESRMEKECGEHNSNSPPLITFDTRLCSPQSPRVPPCDHHFFLDFCHAPDLSIHDDGSIHQAPFSSHSITNFILFILEKCLKVEVNSKEGTSAPVNSQVTSHLKRRNSSQDAIFPKLFKSSSGPREVKRASEEYSLFSTLECTNKIKLWPERKQISKMLFRKSFSSPLEYEEAVTELMIKKNIPKKYGPLEFEFKVNIWILEENSHLALVAGNYLLPLDKKKQFTEFFTYFNSFSNSVLARLKDHRSL